MIDFLILATLWFFGIIVPLGGLILIIRKVIVPYWVKGWSSQWVFWYILGGLFPCITTSSARSWYG